MSKTKKCPICNNENPIAASFCRHCRYEFSEESKNGQSLVPQIALFKVVDNGYCEGSKIRLEWDVKNATKLMLNGKDVTGKTGCNHKIQKTHTLKLRASNAFSNTEAIIELHPDVPARISDFRSLQSKVEYGDQVTLTWSTVGAKRLVLIGNNTEQDVTNQSKASVTLFKNTQYKLVAYSGDESVFEEKTIVIKVLPKILDYSIVESGYFEGDKITFKWKVSNATSISINGTDGTGRDTYSYKVKKKQRTVELIASNREGSVSEIIKLTPIESPSIDNLSLRKNTIESGDATQITWSVSKAARVTLIDSEKEIDVTDRTEYQVSPHETSTYTLRAYSDDGTRFTEKAITLVVLPKIQSFEIVKPEEYCEGSKLLLKWKVGNATSVMIDKEDVTSLTEYRYEAVKANAVRLTASNKDGKVSSVLKLKPNSPARIHYFKADKTTVVIDEKVRLNWDVSDATKIILKTKLDDIDVTNQKQKTITIGESQTVTLIATSVDARIKAYEHIQIEAVSKEMLDKTNENEALTKKLENEKKENTKLLNRVRDLDRQLGKNRKELQSVKTELYEVQKSKKLLHILYMAGIIILLIIAIVASR